ncbi:Probable asparagine--tRNA ligase, mitochondrial [Strongyloides ratti]|uniref:Probable asparagine--tRNA ligase, mitochondrial n=1 Tax=Strongyloides ratti TaxID=34506 RepID=A0A090LH77_STRRB|nr:Probable asparagine--tRNA ligase, mitochondrial [Strongyloides ratti]CEF66830.1 Probable asparagine--tRNA ligase, mitochondrial [Strongyloides ratti]
MLRNIELAKVSIKNLKQLNEDKKNVIVQGFVKKIHKQSNVFFAHISDAFSNDQIQAVIPREIVKKINAGTSIEISGDWLKSLGKQQNFELVANSCKIYNINQSQIIKGSSDSLRKSPHLRPGFPGFANILKLRSKINYLTHKYFYENNFIHIDTPLFSLNDCEGAGETFVVKAQNDNDFFGDDEIYLPVSGQLHLEACAGPLTKVYTLNGAFRADKSLTRQHMAEFRMLEVEVGFCDDTEILCNIVEDYIKYLRNNLLEDDEDIKEIQRTFSDKNRKKSLIEIVSDKQFPRINYEECVDILKKLKKKSTCNGFNKDEEFTLLKYFNSPFFILNFPSNQKPFYMKRFNSNDNVYTKSFDFLSPFVGELAGGSIREDSIEELEKHNIKNISWYVELRKHGYPITGGFGIGIDRLIQSMFAIASIKDTIPFPRYYKHCKC